MEALYGQSGSVHAWLHETGRIYSLSGRNLAFVDDNSVYDWHGAHIGWWQDGHVRDRHGAVGFFTVDAERLGVARPARAARPATPARAASPARPARGTTSEAGLMVERPAILMTSMINERCSPYKRSANRSIALSFRNTEPKRTSSCSLCWKGFCSISGRFCLAAAYTNSRI